MILPDGCCENCDFAAGFTYLLEINQCVCRFQFTFKNGSCELCPSGFSTDLMGNCILSGEEI